MASLSIKYSILIFHILFISESVKGANFSKLLYAQPCNCYNQGICDRYTGACICPSGFVGQQCEQLASSTLCDNVVCKNSGVCNIISATVSTCWCLLGFHGDYCERQKVASSCSQVQCQNGATCYEHSPATSVFAYCLCPPGFTGRFCEAEYFRCLQPGVFADPYKCAQGSYFICDYSNRLISGTCPKGLRFNFNKMSCDHTRFVTCPNI